MHAFMLMAGLCETRMCAAAVPAAKPRTLTREYGSLAAPWPAMTRRYNEHYITTESFEQPHTG